MGQGSKNSAKRNFPIQERCLLWIDGASVIMPDGSSKPRYVYEDGTLDARSSVDDRTTHVEVDEGRLGEILASRAGEAAILGASEGDILIVGLVPPRE